MFLEPRRAINSLAHAQYLLKHFHSSWLCLWCQQMQHLQAASKPFLNVLVHLMITWLLPAGTHIRNTIFLSQIDSNYEFWNSNSAYQHEIWRNFIKRQGLHQILWASQDWYITDFRKCIPSPSCHRWRRRDGVIQSLPLYDLLWQLKLLYLRMACKYKERKKTDMNRLSLWS